MGTSLIASLATHRLISHYVASLLASKSHSSRREQNASLIARSLSFFLLAQETMAFAQLLSGLGPWAFSPGVELGIPIPFDQCCLMFAYANINGVARCCYSCSPNKVPYHCHIQGEPLKPTVTRSTSQKYQSIVTHKVTSQKYHILENGLVPPSLKRAN